MDRVTLKPGRYSLADASGRGDSGGLLCPVDLGEEHGRYGKDLDDYGSVVVGSAVKCGSIFPSTFGPDFWLTTNVAEILTVNKDKTEVTFKTESGTVYTVKSF